MCVKRKEEDEGGGKGRNGSGREMREGKERKKGRRKENVGAAAREGQKVGRNNIAKFLKYPSS